MRRLPDLTGLPTVIESLMRPWVDAVETTPIGMGSVVATAAPNGSASLKRRVELAPASEAALAEALTACDELARKLDHRDTAVNDRKMALSAFAVLTDTLRGARPSESTRDLGLGW